MIIDTHGHTMDGHATINNHTYMSAAHMVDVMDEAGVQQMWVSSITAMHRDVCEANRRQWEETKEFPARFVNFYTAHPQYPELMEVDIRRSIEDRGFRGIKMHPWCSGFPIDNPASRRVVELAIEYNVPVLYHDGTPPWSETLQVAAVADYYPEAKIIIGHAGLLDAYRSAIQACNTHDNIWLCICGPCVGDAEEIIRESRKDRILFGSDYACGDDLGLMAERVRVLRLACPDKDMQEQIFYKNPRELIPQN